MPQFPLVKAMYAFNRAKFLTLTVGGVVGAMSTVLVSCGSRSQTVGGTAEARFVAVTQIVERPALNAIRNGIKDELVAAGYEDEKTLRWEWQSAKGSPLVATHIANKYARARPDVIVAIAPHSAKTIAAATNNTPIIFSAVTNPVGENLIKNTKKPSGNISGVSDARPIRQQLALIQEIVPNIKTLGVIYSTSTGDSESPIARIKNKAPDLEIDIEERLVLSSSDVINAARSLVGSVDAIYVPTDQTVISALEDIIQVGQDNQVPVFAGDTDAVTKGAIAAIDFDYYDVGRQTGAMVVKVLRGSRPSDLAVEGVQTLKLSVNVAAAESMGIELPESVSSRADKVQKRNEERL